MNKQLILVLVIALLVSSCSALRHKKRHNHRLFAQVKQEGGAQNATLQELLELDLSNFSCDNLAEYQQYQGRMEDFVNFFNHNPEEQLQQSIAALGQASLLLKKAKQLFDEPSGISLSQTSKSKLKAKHHYDKLSKHLNNINQIIDPQSVEEIQSAFILISTSDDHEQIKQKIDEVITIIQVLKEQFSNLLSDKDSFEAYSEQLSQKVEDIKNKSESCNA
ncbi:hypothetical protein ABPG74_013300 [Tetrahymena malaccensis]